MAGVVAVTAQSVGELEDIQSGKRDPKKRAHHRPVDLHESIVSGVETIGEIINEINQGN